MRISYLETRIKEKPRIGKKAEITTSPDGQEVLLLETGEYWDRNEWEVFECNIESAKPKEIQALNRILNDSGAFIRDKITAHHEAGHAVIGILTGRDIKYVKIISNEEKRHGTCRFKKPALDTLIFNSNKLLNPEILWIDLAGDIAADKYLKRPGYSLPDENEYLGVTLHHDLGKIYDLLVVWLRWAYEKQTVTKWLYDEDNNIDFEMTAYKYLYTEFYDTEKLINKHWSKIQKVAKALLEKRMLTGDEVNNIIKKWTLEKKKLRKEDISREFQIHMETKIL